ncbi:hypothetical protein Q9L58_008403 [Maublancomyces gigas]|uniref:Uncharacterized protein n=1 Tax=Discina gigas TaxID=1032678 RepID=A0ABR3GAC0_9PEZI
MKLSIFAALLLPLLAAASPTPPTPQITLKLKVWNDPRSLAHFDGYVELHGNKLAYGITPNYQGFTSHHDTPLTSLGTLQDSTTGHYAALIPTTTAGLWSVKFIKNEHREGALTTAFRFLHQQCGNCGGQYLEYRPNVADLSPTTFLIAPAAKAGRFVFYYNNYTANSVLPAGSTPVSLLMDVFV